MQSINNSRNSFHLRTILYVMAYSNQYKLLAHMSHWFNCFFKNWKMAIFLIGECGMDIQGARPHNMKIKGQCYQSATYTNNINMKIIILLLRTVIFIQRSHATYILSSASATIGWNSSNI